MNNFFKRLIFGAIYVAVVVASIVWFAQAFAPIFLVVSMLAVREYHVLVHSSRAQTILSTIAGGLLFFLFCMPHALPAQAMAVMPVVAVVYGFLLLSGLVAELFLKAENPIQNWGHLLCAQVMVAIPFGLMNYILAESQFLLLALFITIWVNDTFAYCVGSLTAKLPGGNHKMFPRVSPAKSWEGLMGGIVFSLLAGYVYHLLGWIPNVAEALLYAFLISIAGTLGDLMESLLKRTVGVKDSGIFLPGHGGVLDRFDSMLLATPVVAMVLFFLSLAL